MKKLLYFIAPIILAAACDSHEVVTRLAEIDSLLVEELNDSAYQLIQLIDEKKYQNQRTRLITIC